MATLDHKGIVALATLHLRRKGYLRVGAADPAASAPTQPSLIVDDNVLPILLTVPMLNLIIAGVVSGVAVGIIIATLNIKPSKS